MAEIDSSLLFKTLQKQGLLNPGTPVSIPLDFPQKCDSFQDDDGSTLMSIGAFQFKAQAAKCMGTHLIYDAQAVERVNTGEDFPPEAIIAAVNEIYQLKPVFK